MWRYLIPVAIFAVLFGFLFVGLNRDPSYVPSPLIGKSAPTFSLTTVEDPAKKISPEDFRGKPFVLNVWGTWCVECRREHDALLEISRQGLVPIVGLNWKDELDPAQQWLRQLGDPYTVAAFDPEGRAGIDWGVYGAPETFLIDANGVIVYKHIAPITIEVWNREFVPRIQSSGGRS
jgi:cytochrome c biogenesis protein CcmG/thiol:disulfide interchange protein DsbE